MVFQATLTLSVRPTLGDSRVKVNFILPHKASETWDGNEEKGLCNGQPIIFHQYLPPEGRLADKQRHCGEFRLCQHSPFYGASLAGALLNQEPTPYNFARVNIFADG